MATRISECITQKLIAASVIEEGDRELYSYGFFLLVTRLFFFAITVLAGILMDIPGESILFYIMFLLLRSYAGGAHARTERTCTVLTTCSLTASVFGIRLLKFSQSKLVPLIMLAVGTLCVFAFSPLDTAEKPLDKQDRRHYRRVSLAIVCIHLLLAVYACAAARPGVLGAVAFSMLMESILLIVGKVVPLWACTDQ